MFTKLKETMLKDVKDGSIISKNEITIYKKRTKWKFWS